MNTENSEKRAASAAEDPARGVSAAIRQGASAASQAVAALSSTGEIASKSVYHTFFYLSYGVVYVALQVASVVPTGNAMGAGMRDGTEAATEAATSAVSDWKQRRAARRAAAQEEHDSRVMQPAST